jgi:hypothetical protein
MKSIIRTALLGALTMLALSLATAGVAAAATLPEFKPVPTKKKFTSTSGTVTWKMGTETITCTKSTTAGEITGVSSLGKTVIKFTGCRFKNSGGTECPLHSVGAKSEEVVTDALKGELGTVEKSEAASGAGLLLEPETGSAISAVTSACNSPTETELEGKLAGEVATVGKKATTDKLVFGVTSGKQDIKEITVKSGTKKPAFRGWGFAAITMEASDELTFEEALEVT